MRPGEITAPRHRVVIRAVADGHDTTPAPYLPRGINTRRARILAAIGTAPTAFATIQAAAGTASMGAVGSALDYFLRRGMIARVGRARYVRVTPTTEQAA